MRRFELLQTKHNTEIRCRPMAHDVHLTRYTGYSVISYCRDLAEPEAIVAVAIMFGALELDWSGQRFGFYFPLEDDPRILREKQRQLRRDYRPAIKRAGRILLPDAMIDELRREGREPWELVERERVTKEMVQIRMRDWAAARQDVVFLYQGA